MGLTQWFKSSMYTQYRRTDYHINRCKMNGINALSWSDNKVNSLKVSEIGERERELCVECLKEFSGCE